MFNPSESEVPSNRATDSRRDQLALIVLRIQAGDAVAIEELYMKLRKGVHWFLCRQLRSDQDAEDGVHEVIIQVIQDIQRFFIREPERITGYTLTVARRQALKVIGERTKFGNISQVGDRFLRDLRNDPERQFVHRERIQLVQQVLAELRPKDRQILKRFYLEEGRPEQICGELGIDLAQFQLVKTRAKARFAAIGKKKAAGSVGRLAAELEFTVTSPIVKESLKCHLVREPEYQCDRQISR